MARHAMHATLVALVVCGGSASAAVAGPTTVAYSVGPFVASDLNVTSFSITTPAGSTAPVSYSGFWVSFSDNETSFSSNFGLLGRDFDGPGAGDPFSEADRLPNLNFIDDTLNTFEDDRHGFIDRDDFDNFFGVTDTVNDDSNLSDTALYQATWQFDVSGAVGALGVSVDLAAMGDFEPASRSDGLSTDVLRFEYSFDGVTFTDLITNSILDTSFQRSTITVGEFTFSGVIDPEVPGQSPEELLLTQPEVVYTMDSGALVAWNDPLLMNGVLIKEDFTTVSAPVTGQGSSLYVRFSANADNANEVLAFRNLTVTATPPPVLPGDYNADGTVDAADYTVYRDALAGVPGVTLQNETASSGEVDQADYTAWADNFGAASAVAVPEPLSATLAAAGLLVRPARRGRA